MVRKTTITVKREVKRLFDTFYDKVIDNKNDPEYRWIKSRSDVLLYLLEKEGLFLERKE